jgi:Uma2 family endonuclease
MMVAVETLDLPPMSEAEYLGFADEQEIKYEYRRGQVYAMTGASVRHNTIVANAITELSVALRDRDCTVTSSDTRVHIASKKTYRYPDVTLFCDDAEYLEGRTDTITNPVLLVEVLSLSSGLRDRNDKLVEYTQIDTLDAYVLISQDEPKVEVFRRHEGDQWLFEYVTGLDTKIDILAAGTVLRLTLAQIYRRVSWEDDEA